MPSVKKIICNGECEKCPFGKIAESQEGDFKQTSCLVKDFYGFQVIIEDITGGEKC